MKETRGVRNRNPGNIDHQDGNKWQGELPVNKLLEARFCRFDTAENGIRALGKLLLTYHNKYGLKTVKAIIGRWAPPKENDTGAYVRSVQLSIKAATGHDAEGEINIDDQKTMKAVVTAIIKHENSGYIYPDAVVNEGVRRALE